MLTSKEIIERTGISRATLNNYIASGLVPRPQVLPPGPEHGAAPRIGYFPEDTVARIEAIQRLKREGWSITRIAEHLAAHPPAAVPEAARAEVPGGRIASSPLPAPVQGSGASSAAAGRLWLREVRHPAYIVDDAFRIVWANEEARVSPLSPLAGGSATGGVFQRLLETDAARGREAILRLHADVARQRSTAVAELLAGMPQGAAGSLEALLGEARVQEPRLVSHLLVPAGGGAPARLAYAVHLRDGVLFAFAPAPDEDAAGAARLAAAAPAAPRLTPVAVLVASLQDAHGLWVRLTAQEYFELLNEVWTELDRVFRRHHGVRGLQAGEVLVSYFLPGAGQGYLFNALAAAQQTRDAMRQVSRRWHKRKSWDIELTMNVGIDEGQEWMGGVGSAALGAVRVLGDAPDRAEQLSRSSRLGTILLTRSLIGKLPPEDLQRVTYGVPAPDGSEARVLFTFARLEEIASPSTVPARFADLAVAELLDLKTTNPEAAAHGAP